MNKFKQRGARAAHTAANLAVEISQQEEPARIRSMDRWRRAQDAPARRDKSRNALCFNAWVSAVGYSSEVKPVLLAALAATYGEDRFVTCADWRAACYLKGDGSDIQRLEKLPANDPERRALAKAWRAAWDALESEQRSTGYASVLRQSGKRERGKNKASELHVVFAQHMVEIDRLAKTMKGRRLEKYTRAASEYVATLPCNPVDAPDESQVFACPTCGKTDCSHNGDRAPRETLPTEPNARFLAKVQKASTELANSPLLPAEKKSAYNRARVVIEVMKGDSPDQAFLEQIQQAAALLFSTSLGPEEKQALRLRAHQLLEETFADQDEPVAESTLIYTEDYPDNFSEGVEATLENVVFADQAITEPAKNAGQNEFSVPKNGTLNLAGGPSERGTLGRHTCPSPEVEPELIEERVFIMCEAGDVAEDVAAQIARRDLCEVCRGGPHG